MGRKRKGLWGPGLLEADNATMMYEVTIKKLAMQVDEAVAGLVELKGPDQWVLAIAHGLRLVCRGFPNGARQAMKRSQVLAWKEAFFEWFASDRPKFPKEYRDGIEQEAIGLFDELLEFAVRG